MRFFRKRDQEGRPSDSGGPSALSSRLLPLFAIAVLIAIYGAVAAYYLVMGEVPGFDGQPRVVAALPARGGAELPGGALLEPPRAQRPTAEQVPGDGQAGPARESTPDAAPDQAAGDAAPDQAAPEPAAVPAASPATPAGQAAAPASTLPRVPEVANRAPPSLDALPPPPGVPPLPEVPASNMIERTAHGELPTLGPGGRLPWQVYGRPFADLSDKPRIAVLVGGLGLNSAVTEAAISKLPAEVSLAFSPYARDLQTWIGKARDAGHEVFLELPMEPVKYPARDPGPLGLLSSLEPSEVEQRFRRLMGKAAGYAGFVAPVGSPFAATPGLDPVLAEMRRRGLLYVGDAVTGGDHPGAMPAFVPVTRAIDAQPFRDAIDARLEQVEAAARQAGSALALAEPLPVSIERLALWIPTILDRGVLLAPVTAVARPAAS